MAYANKHIVNSNGKGENAFSDTWHALRRTADGKLYCQLRDKNVGTFDNGQGTLANDDDYVTEDLQFVSGISETVSGANGSETSFTTTTNFGVDEDRLHITIDTAVQNHLIDYTISGTTLTFTVAPHNGASILIRLKNKRYFNQVGDTFQQYRFQNGNAYYKIDDNGKLNRIENKRYTLTEVVDDYDSYDGSAIVNSTTYSV